MHLWGEINWFEITSKTTRRHLLWPVIVMMDFKKWNDEQWIWNVLKVKRESRKSTGRFPSEQVWTGVGSGLGLGFGEGVAVPKWTIWTGPGSDNMGTLTVNRQPYTTKTLPSCNFIGVVKFSVTPTRVLGEETRLTRTCPWFTLNRNNIHHRTPNKPKIVSIIEYWRGMRTYCMRNIYCLSNGNLDSEYWRIVPSSVRIFTLELIWNFQRFFFMTLRKLWTVIRVILIL